MKTRIPSAKAAPGVYEAMDGLDAYLGACALERPLLLLVQLRASQVNGCVSIAARLTPGAYRPTVAA
ncbi:MAG TPA: hypothetical protein VGO40_03285 [Longimicrobium sp.]|jgi:alkylhydroperoxidase family enzyme|nr:hypothetical protein [Longimicrobium sp.]